MSGNYQSAFLHLEVHENQSLVESVCARCHEFVGASKNLGNLKIAEAAHTCPGVPGPVPRLVQLTLKRPD